MSPGNTVFLAMPFGRKPIPGSRGKHYDFEKVWRVLIKPAIQQAGLQPLRADQLNGSHAHDEMLQALCDCRVVLADLTLLNPNVLVEIGYRLRHRPAALVLIAREGTELPFDLQIFRVIFYACDGQTFDAEEAARVIKVLRSALLSACDGDVRQASL
jgi:hypothetical protein